MVGFSSLPYHTNTPNNGWIFFYTWSYLCHVTLAYFGLFFTMVTVWLKVKVERVGPIVNEVVGGPMTSNRRCRRVRYGLRLYWLFYANISNGHFSFERSLLIFPILSFSIPSYFLLNHFWWDSLFFCLFFQTSSSL